MGLGFATRTHRVRHFRDPNFAFRHPLQYGGTPRARPQVVQASLCHRSCNQRFRFHHGLLLTHLCQHPMVAKRVAL